MVGREQAAGSGSGEGRDQAENAGPRGANATEPEMITVFEAVGGFGYFDRLVDDFYDRVDRDPVLRPLYPEDLTESRRRTSLFLAQFWGGPPTYSEERGHPRLRARHLPFPIGLAERDAWLAHMMEAVDTSTMGPLAGGPALAPVIRDLMAEYFERSSTAMINQSE